MQQYCHIWSIFFWASLVYATVLSPNHEMFLGAIQQYQKKATFLLVGEGDNWGVARCICRACIMEIDKNHRISNHIITIERQLRGSRRRRSSGTGGIQIKEMASTNHPHQGVSLKLCMALPAVFQKKLNFCQPCYKQQHCRLGDATFYNLV